MAHRCLAVVAALSSVLGAELRVTSQARQSALEAEWGSELQQAPKVVEYQSPIKRVVGLLKKMKEELVHETKTEAEMYDKMVCWCETNHKEKTKAISDASAKDAQLTSEIESRSSRFGNLGTQIEALKKEVGDLTEALKKAVSLREKGAKTFQGEEVSLTAALTNVKNAIVILSKHQSFMQVGSTQMMAMKTVLRDLAMKHEMLTDHDTSMRRKNGLRTSLLAISSSSERASAHESTHMNRELLTALDIEGAGSDDTLPLKFAERLVTQTAESATPVSFLQVEKPPGYSSASGPVSGMLEQLQSDFKSALAKAQEDEKRDISDFEALAKAKSAQIEASKEKLDDLEDEAGDNTKSLSDAKEDLETTRDQRSADSKFLVNLKTTCSGLDKQWAERSKTRGAETIAVAEALAIITQDDNMDLMRGSVKFVQVASKMMDTRSAKAADVLQSGLDDMFEGGGDDLLDAWEGRHSDNKKVQKVPIRSAADPLHGARTQLAVLAVTVKLKLDSFTKVKAAMKNLVSELKQQQKEEVEFNSKCVKDFNGNEKAVFKKTDLKEDLEAKIKELAAHMKALGKDINDAKSKMAEAEVEVKKASQNREAENAQFQTVVADQRATQDILKKALAKLNSFYKKAFVQVADADEYEQTPPVQFSGERKSNAGASPVIGMIQAIIEDSAHLEAESVASEKQAQADYETFVKDSNDLIKTLSDSVVSNSKAMATAKSESATASGDLENANGELESLGKVEQDLHAECDFIQKNFEVRQKARLTEIEAIHSAMGVLSGAKAS